ncbi:DNA gyrase subunit A [Nitrolancea hollandica]|uniref:DNA gyrase subunit A n=1 Tax=Nitrolancea hollandica Lb TaxID=1129897 RepID=I4ENK4_9BACT|nr:DNA gyrase subunit A [Nitrolancea hollandica]CCF86267.1 DNA gyrase (subunit A) [Nitrolancea hollandica Lb]
MDIGTVRSVNIDTEMRRSYLDYAMSVIVQRALPDVRDGLKPVQRRILYAMHEMGIRPTTKYRKSAGIVGEVLKSYHPHGDSAVYDALVRMVQPFSLRYPLVDGQGNFGSVDGDGAAAMRYTEARLEAIAEELLQDIEKQTIDFVPNYDGEAREPVVLPAKLPNLLVNGASGIAVGMATNIPPHNLTEVCDGLIYLIDNPEATVDELIEIIPGPDFPTGGIILGREGIKAAYATGKGRVVIRARTVIEEAGRGNRFQIIVTELPYQVNKAALIEKIAELVKVGRIDGIHDLRDESDRTGMRVIIELKRDAQPRKVLNALFKHTQLQQTFGVNMLALVDGTQPRVLTLKRSLQLYLTHREEVVRRRTEFELLRARRRAHILEGLKIALDHLDAVIKTIRESRTADVARSSLMAKFALTEVQANAILEMQLRRLAALERRKIEQDYRDLLKQISGLELLLADPDKILQVIKEELIDLKEAFGDERRTHIQDMSGEITDEDLIPEVNVLVMLTNRGYVKRLPDGTYRTQHRGGRGVTGMTVRETDGVQRMVAANSHDSLLFFTNRGRVFHIKVHELPDAGRTAKGTPVINLIGIQPGEAITTLLPVRNFADATYLFMCTRSGRVKRTRLDQFSSVRASGLIAISLDEGDELAWVRMTSGSDDLILVTEHGQSIRFHEEDVRAMGRQAAGVIGIRMNHEDRVIAAEVVAPDCDLLVVSANGYGKRTPLDEYRVQNRGGLGITAMKVTERNGPLAAARVVCDTDTIMLVSTHGMVIRVPAAQISRIGRATQGVGIMRVHNDDVVASLTVIRTTQDEEIANVEEASVAPTGGTSTNGRDPEV